MKERSSSSPRAHLPPSVGRRFSSPTSAPAEAAGSGLGGGEGKGEGGGRRGLGRARAGMWMDGWMDGWMDEGAVFPLGSMEIYGHGIGRRRFSAEGGQVRGLHDISYGRAVDQATCDTDRLADVALPQRKRSNETGERQRPAHEGSDSDRDRQSERETGNHG